MRKQHTRLFALAAFCLVIICSSLQAMAQEPLVNNVFDNTYLVDALRDVSAQTGVAIVPDSTVGGQVTMALENVPFEAALTRLLAPGGYVFRKLSDYYLVGSPDIKNPSFVLLSETVVIKLRYVKAENAAKLLAETFSQFIKVSPETNSLVITAPRVIIDRIKADLAAIDTPIPQVAMEALVVEVSHNGRKDLGLEWRWDHIGGVPDLGNPGGATVQFADLELDLAYVTPGGLDKFLVALKAAVEKGEARIAANPRVVTLDNQAAEIFIGRERFYPINNGQSGAAVPLESIKTGITLRMLPMVSESGEITVRVEPEVSDVVADSAANGNLPVISRRRVSTTVRIKDGDSIVLGGLIQRVDHTITSKVPILGDIPLLGFFFKKTESVTEEGEVLIIITTKIFRDSLPQAPPQSVQPAQPPAEAE